MLRFTISCTIFLTLTTGFILFVYIIFLEHAKHYTVQRITIMTYESENYKVNTSGCQIPALDPFHPTIKHLLRRLPDLSCSSPLSDVEVKNNTIRLADTYQSVDVSCSLQEITRINDFVSEIGRPILVERSATTVTSEFVQVTCERAAENSTIVQFYPFIQRKEKVEKRIMRYKQETKTSNSHQFRIIMLGLDSVSKSQFMRHMVKTQKFMKQYLTYAEMHGYNKLGQITYSNIVPMFCGRLATEVFDTSLYFADALPFIWKEYMDQGYRTLFSEDAPVISIFNYARRGFYSEPTDYYLRPWNIAVEHFLSKWKTGCLNDRVETTVILNYLEDFYNVFQTDPLFAFTFLTRLSHNDVNSLSYQDKPVRDFLERLHFSGQLNNTIMFFFSDHGYRFGPIRSTKIGRMEVKLPFMFVIVPSWFPNKYPQMYKNLKVNEKRLTTPLDVYATLQDFLHFNGEGFETEGKGRSISLLKHPIPFNRTCRDAAIQDQWCSCTKSEPVALDKAEVLASASGILDKINSITEKYRKDCAELQLTSILNASKQDVDLDEESESDVHSNYLVTVKVSPSAGIFEGSVWLGQNGYYLVEDTVERINSYGNQSTCVNENVLKPFCYCVKRNR